jgi:leucyl aminopeptidase (aminopeptidase T)
VNEVLAVKKDERVLLISNPGGDVRELSMAIFDACLDVDAAPSLIFQREKSQFDFAEEEVIKAMSAEPQVVISMSKEKLGKDRWGMKKGYKGKHRHDHILGLLFEEKKMRGFWSPGTTRDMFRRTVPIDYSRLRRDCARVVRALAGSRSVNVTAPGGTDVTIGIRGRKARSDDGNYRKPGQSGNVPSGEVFVSPTLGTMNGTVAFDGSITLHEGEIVIKRPIMTEVKDGFVTSISGGAEALKLEESVHLGEKNALEAGKRGELRAALVQEYARNARSIGELGIGLNRKARIIANMLEDEKVYGTCHFAVGSNYDDDAEALIHLDGLVKRPTITVVGSTGKERTLMDAGKLIWD